MALHSIFLAILNNMYLARVYTVYFSTLTCATNDSLITDTKIYIYQGAHLDTRKAIPNSLFFQHLLFNLSSTSLSTPSLQILFQHLLFNNQSVVPYPLLSCRITLSWVLSNMRKLYSLYICLIGRPKWFALLPLAFQGEEKWDLSKERKIKLWRDRLTSNTFCSNPSNLFFL